MWYSQRILSSADWAKCDIETDKMWASSRGVEANVFDYNIVVSKFELKFCYVYFRINTLGKGMNRLIHFNYKLESTTIVLLPEATDIKKKKRPKHPTILRGL